MVLRLSPERADLDACGFGRVAPPSACCPDLPSSAEVWGEGLDGLGEGVVVGRWCEVGGHGSIVGDLSQRRKSLVGVGLRGVWAVVSGEGRRKLLTRRGTVSYLVNMNGGEGRHGG